MLTAIKKRLYILVSTYDVEIQSLIDACVIDSVMGGVKSSAFDALTEGGAYDDLALTLVTAYVKAYRGMDRSDTNLYVGIYNDLKARMALSTTYGEADE